jgi:hypothetical protein
VNDPKFLNSLPKLIIVSELLNIEIDANNLEKLVKVSNGAIQDSFANCNISVDLDLFN